MGFLGSGDKKTNSFDQRTAGSDNAQVSSHGGRIFNVGGKGNPTAAFQTEAVTSQLPTVAIVAVAIVMIWAITKK